MPDEARSILSRRASKVAGILGKALSSLVMTPLVLSASARSCLVGEDRPDACDADCVEGREVPDSLLGVFIRLDARGVSNSSS